MDRGRAVLYAEQRLRVAHLKNVGGDTRIPETFLATLLSTRDFAQRDEVGVPMRQRGPCNKYLSIEADLHVIHLKAISNG
jgi:hypothetical protein